MRLTNLAALGAVLLSLCACASVLETQRPRTATEQLLVSHAAERAAIKLKLALPAGAAVFVDASRVTGEGADDLVGAVRAELARHGARLVERPAADIVVELRCGALSIDQADKVWGMPAMSLPAPSAGASHGFTTVTTPELSLYSEHERTGVAEISALALDAHTGAMVAMAGPAFGETSLVGRKLLTTMSFGSLQLRPPGAR